MVRIKDANYKRKFIKGGNDAFSFSIFRLNSPAIIQGVMENCEQLVREESRWQSQPCSIFCDQVHIVGKLYPQILAEKSIKVERNSTRSFVDSVLRRKAKLDSLKYTTFMCEGYHETNTLNDAAITHLKRIQHALSEPDLYSGKTNEHLERLFFFTLRDGEVYAEKMLIGRNMNAVMLYSEPNWEARKILHNQANKREIKMILNYCVKCFKFVSETSLDDALALWSRSQITKDAKPAWNNEVMENFNLWPVKLRDIMDKEMIARGTLKYVEGSWRWWHVLFQSESIHDYVKEQVWNIVTHWYRKMGITYSMMLDECIDDIVQDYEEYNDLNKLAVNFPRQCGVMMNGRDSTGVTSALMQDRYLRVNVKEDKQRNVGRGFTSALSIFKFTSLEDYVYKETDQTAVINGDMWRLNKTCLSGLDFKKSDQIIGDEANLPSYARGGKSLVIHGLAMLSGEWFTAWLSDLLHYKKCKLADIHRMIKTVAGDDLGLKVWLYAEFLKKFKEKYPFDMDVLAPKQTYDTRTDRGERRVVFNLGNSILWKPSQEFDRQWRAAKLVRTEQTPVGKHEGYNLSWDLLEEAVASFDDINIYEAPLWYSDDWNSFNDFLGIVVKLSHSSKWADLPESLDFLAT